MLQPLSSPVLLLRGERVLGQSLATESITCPTSDYIRDGWVNPNLSRVLLVTIYAMTHSSQIVRPLFCGVIFFSRAFFPRFFSRASIPLGRPLGTYALIW